MLNCIYLEINLAGPFGIIKHSPNSRLVNPKDGCPILGALKLPQSFESPLKLIWSNFAIQFSFIVTTFINEEKLRRVAC
jgi:hypothetical protein